MFAPTADGGHARYTWELLNALSVYPGAPYQVELVSSRDLDRQFYSDNYPVHPILPPIVDRKTFATRFGWIANRLTHYPRREWALLKWLKGRADVSAVHFQEWTVWLAAPFFRRVRAMGKRVYYTAHNVVPHKYPKSVPRSVVNHWIRSAWRECDGLFVHTPRLADELSRFARGNHPPIHVVPHGVWTVHDFAAGRKPADRLADKRLLFFGSIRANKGIELLLRAMEHLHDYSLTIAGEPVHHEFFETRVRPLIAEMRATGAKINLIDRFVPDDHVASLIAGHSAIVLPYTSNFVAQSGVVYTALAYEIPVVASEAGGLRELLNEYRIGQTFTEPTPHALAQAVRQLHSAPADDLAQQVQLAKRRYSWKEAARATFAGYAAETEPIVPEHDCIVSTTAAN